MLIVEIAVGVFLGGLGLWAFTSYQERNKQAHYVESQIASLFEVANGWITQRFGALSSGYLDVFRQRLTTIYDIPKHTPLVAAQAEFEIFIKNTDELKAKVAAEIQEALKESFLTADKFGTREKLNEQIDLLIGSAIVQLKNDGMWIYTNTLLGMGRADRSAIHRPFRSLSR